MRTHAIGPFRVEPFRPRGRAAMAAARRGPLPLAVPGCVHHVLLEAGLIPPPDLDDGEARQEWVGRSDWRLVARFPTPERGEGERVDLVLDELDAAGEVFLNGVRLGGAASAFCPHRCAVAAFLRADGENELELRMRGPVTEVERLERRLGPRPVNGDWTPYPFLRTSACGFGWDWGPRTPTVGIGAARLEIVRIARLASVRPLVVACDERAARVEVHASIDRVVADAGLHATVSLVAPDGRRFDATGAFDTDAVTVTLEVPEPARWWPRGLGDRPRYALEVEVREGDRPLDAWHGRIGLRTVELDRSPDADGERFEIRVNGRPVQVRGANWIPEGLFPTRPEPGRMRRLVERAAAANLNMLRVWGGGRYESREFLEACDELGLLVWQDFMFACATYPEEPPYDALVEREARHQVARHAAHPSVALWCGGNEDILAWFSWGFRERLRPGQTWGRRFWLESLPAIVAELDPTRPYWPESPWSGSLDVHPNDPDRGDRHTWDLAFEAFTTMVPRFCSEFGRQSPPTLASLREALSGERCTLGSDALAERQRAWGGDAVQYAPALAERFGPLRDLDEFVFAAQLLQARHYALAFHWLRANAPRCMGMLFWQWNDVWTGHSWSVLDARLRPKPAFFAVRHAAAARALAIVPRAAGSAELEITCLEAMGETEGPSPARVRLRLADPAGRVREAGEVALVRRNPWTLAAALPAAVATRAALGPDLLVADALGTDGSDLRATALGVFDAARSDPPPRCGLRADADGVTLEAETLLRDLCVLPELVDPAAVARDGMRTLLPGERVMIGIDAAPASPARDAARLATTIRTANLLSGRGTVAPG